MSQLQRRFSMLALMSACVIAGCTAAPTAKEEFDAAEKAYENELAQLDRLRPAYDTAKQAAILNVTKELAGATPDEAMTGALGQLDSMTKALQDQAATNTKPGDLNAQIDQMVATQGDTLKQIGTLTGSAGKTNEVMKNIRTPGTPEAKRYEEVLAAMPEVQAYERQQRRLDRAKQAMDEAEAKLPGGTGAKKASDDNSAKTLNAAPADPAK